MLEYNIKQRLSNERGVTLVALLITIVLMVIIVSVTVNIGTDSLDSTKLKGFYMHLDTIQKRVDDIAITNETYTINNEDGTTTEIDLKTSGGSSLTERQITVLQTILDKEEINIPTNEFRYFTISDLREQLDLIEMDYNVFIHFDTRTVVAEKGITIDGKTYYALKSDMYFPEYDSNKNQGEITSLSYDVSKYGTERYKITVMPSNSVGDLDTTGTLRYKKTTTKYWETANSLEIIITELTQYNIEYKDKNNNTITEIIEVELDEDDNPIYNKITE